MDNIHNINSGNGNRQRVEVTPEDLTQVECECGGQIFQKGHESYKLSKVHPKNPTNEAQIIHVPVNICLGCGNITTDQDLKK